jgi:hypothetical protein
MIGSAVVLLFVFGVTFLGMIVYPLKIFLDKVKQRKKVAAKVPQSSRVRI